MARGECKHGLIPYGCSVCSPKGGKRAQIYHAPPQNDVYIREIEDPTDIQEGPVLREDEEYPDPAEVTFVQPWSPRREEPGEALNPPNLPGNGTHHAPITMPKTRSESGRRVPTKGTCSVCSCLLYTSPSPRD